MKSAKGAKILLPDGTEQVIAAAIVVHQSLGPGLLESAYEACLAFELVRRGHAVERQKPVPVVYQGVKLDCGYRIDLLVDHRIVVELKCAVKLTPVDDAQLISYLRLGGYPVGLLMNFHALLLKQGLRRLVNAPPA